LENVVAPAIGPHGSHRGGPPFIQKSPHFAALPDPALAGEASGKLTISPCSRYATEKVVSPVE